jgi:hypothetical protein
MPALRVVGGTEISSLFSVRTTAWYAGGGLRSAAES